MNEKTKTFIVLLGIFILAFSIRSYMIKYNSLFEYDSFFHARMTEDFLIHKTINHPDMLAYYQLGGAPQTYFNYTWALVAAIYQLLFGWNVGYNHELFTKLFQILPAFFGAIICIVFYFIAKEISNKKSVGIIVALIAAIMPAFIYRTMTGAQLDNAYGFLPFSLGILFLILAYKEQKISKKSILFSILSGGLFASMILSWAMYLIVPIILIPFFVFYSLHKLTKPFNKDTNLLALTNLVIIFGIFQITSVITKYNWISSISSFSHIPEFIIMIGSILAIFFSIITLLLPNLTIKKEKMKIFLSCCFLFASLLIIFLLFSNIDLTDRTSLGSLVGEEAYGKNFFIHKFNIFLILIPLGLFVPTIFYYWLHEKADFLGIFFAGFLLFLFMGWIKLKFSFSLGYGLILISVIIVTFLYELYQYMQKNNKTEAKILYVFGIIFILFGISAGGVFILDYVPPLEADPSLKEVIEFFKNETPKDTKIFNEWGIGHILTYETRRAVSADNRNAFELANQQFAKFVNDTNVHSAYELVKSIGADYIILDKHNFYSLRINEMYIAGKIDQKIGTKFLDPLINIIECSRINNILNCNGKNIDESQYNKWSETPTEFFNGMYPLYAYVYNNSLIILNKASNNTNIAKIFFNEENTMKYYTKVLETSKYLIVKVNK